MQVAVVDEKLGLAYLLLGENNSKGQDSGMRSP